MKFELKDVRPNPFRRMEKYPILPEKVDALKESIESTGFWENIVGREVGGKLEIAYGHHRLAALKAVYPATQEFDWRVRKLSDGTMIQMMTRENSETYETNAAVLMESVRAAVEAYAKGLFEMPPPPKDTPNAALRYAPSFVAEVPGCAAQPRAYTAVTLGRFLGLTWKRERGGEQAQTKLLIVLNALETIELLHVSEDQFRGMSFVALDLRIKDLRTDAEEREVREARAKRLKEIAERERIRRDEVAQRTEEAHKAEEDAKRKAAEEVQRKDEETKARREAERKEREAKAAEGQEARRKEREAKEAREREKAARELAEKAERDRKAAEKRAEEAEEERRKAKEAAEKKRIADAKAETEQREREKEAAAKARAEATRGLRVRKLMIETVEIGCKAMSQKYHSVTPTEKGELAEAFDGLKKLVKRG